MSESFDLQSARERWTKGQLKCRGRERHDFRDWVVRFHKFRSAAKDYYEVVEQCFWCKNQRSREMSTGGVWLTKWRPFYRKDYLVPKGTGRLPDSIKTVLRLDEVVARHVEVVDEEAA